MIYPLEELRNLENFIFENSVNFEKEFCHEMELISVSFKSSGVDFVFMDSYGQHLSNGISVYEFNNWVCSL